MQIQLSKDRMLTSDKHQYMLCKLSSRKNRETEAIEAEWSPYRFYPSLKCALEAVPEQMLKESNADGWEECKVILRRTYHMLTKRLRV